MTRCHVKHDALIISKRFLFPSWKGGQGGKEKYKGRQVWQGDTQVPSNLQAELHLFMPKLACNGVHIKMLKTTPSFLRSLGWPEVDLEVPGFGSNPCSTAGKSRLLRAT